MSNTARMEGLSGELEVLGQTERTTVLGSMFSAAAMRSCSIWASLFCLRIILRKWRSDEERGVTTGVSAPWIVAARCITGCLSPLLFIMSERVPKEKAGSEGEPAELVLAVDTRPRLATVGRVTLGENSSEPRLSSSPLGFCSPRPTSADRARALISRKRA